MPSAEPKIVSLFDLLESFLSLLESSSSLLKSSLSLFESVLSSLFILTFIWNISSGWLIVAF